MKHRILVTALASIMLAGSVGAVTVPTQTVQAISKHSYRWHWVKTNRDMKVYKLRFPLYRRPVFDGILEKGSEMPVRYISHHGYFEIKGWAENKIIVRFWIIALISNLIALTALKIR